MIQRFLRPIRTALLASILTTGCSFLMEAGLDLADVPRERKVVAEKSAPDRLLATDGTLCVVPEFRFAAVDVGDRVTCFWVDRGQTHLQRSPSSAIFSAPHLDPSVMPGAR